MPDRVHLSARHRRALEALLREHLPDVEVWAYGSRVNGLGHEGSDLDLVLRGPGLEDIPADQLLDFEEAVRESTIPFLVEARDWARLPRRFHRAIEREYVVVVGGDPAVSGDDVEQQGDRGARKRES
ncbi:nucleotidyltransferase domain-containing protein [Candidatus Palauibacter sp.]|uniref:nucleotidyltransferase domain-containing protein n=1 Tax=Candidatus Palauibacter sp. TaxID=3101350 RepID=UPI003B5A6110